MARERKPPHGAVVQHESDATTDAFDRSGGSAIDDVMATPHRLELQLETGPVDFPSADVRCAVTVESAVAAQPRFVRLVDAPSVGFGRPPLSKSVAHPNSVTDPACVAGVDRGINGGVRGCRVIHCPVDSPVEFVIRVSFRARVVGPRGVGVTRSRVGTLGARLLRARVPLCVVPVVSGTGRIRHNRTIERGFTVAPARRNGSEDHGDRHKKTLAI